MTLRRHIWKKVLLCAVTVSLLYVEIYLLWFMKMDWGRSQVQEWPRNLESLNLFWIEACFTAAWTQLLAVCLSVCIRQFWKQPVSRKPLLRKTWKRLFFGGTLTLVFLIAAACHFGPLQTTAYAAREDSAAYYASVFYLLVIAAEFVSGLLICLLWDLLRSRKQMRT